MRCLGVLGGEMMPDEVLLAWEKECGKVLAADHGLDHCLRSGIRPDAVVGDLDSVSADLATLGVEVFRDTDPDRSDVEKLLDLAARWNQREVVLVCAHGGRVDHLLASFCSAILSSLNVRWVFPLEHAVLIRPGFDGLLPLGAGRRVSLMPLENACQVTWEGVQWPLKDQTLRAGYSWSLSNVTALESVRLKVEEAHALLLVENAPEEIPVW